MTFINSKLPNVGTTIFSVMSKLAQDHNAINLSQGFPDYDADPKLIDYVAQAMLKGNNQYAPMPGVLALRELISAKMERLYHAYYHPDTEVTITAGGTQAIFTALAAVIHPGDEVIIFEPAYDSYAPTINLLGGKVVPFELHAPDYEIDWTLVKAMISERTKMIIINNPQNPTGSILAKSDLESLTRLTENTNILILSDEVYEHIVYDNAQHQSVALYPSLKERSFIIASFGKLLHTTGWKLGYCLAPSYLMGEFRKVHQFNVFSVNTPMQIGIANYLKDESIYSELATFFQEKRDFFRSLLKETKLNLLPCRGSYFQCVSYATISEEQDLALAKKWVEQIGVACIPVSAFYSQNMDEKILRFCFAKKRETLEMAVERLIHL